MEAAHTRVESNRVTCKPKFHYDKLQHNKFVYIDWIISITDSDALDMDTKSTDTTQSHPLSAPPPYSPPREGLYATANPAYQPDETGLNTIATRGIISYIQPPPAYTPQPVNVHLNTCHAQTHVQVRFLKL